MAADHGMHAAKYRMHPDHVNDFVRASEPHEHDVQAPEV